MAHTQDERERRLAERERAAQAHEAEAKRLLAEARAAHRDAERERGRARKLANRFARKLQYTLVTTRAQLDDDRAALDARVARFNETQSAFHLASAADRDRQQAAWADLAARQKRLAAEWAEATRFHADQAAALDARAAELATREKTETDTKSRLQREVAALREEAAALDVRVRNSRLLVDELEQRRAELRAESLAPGPVAGTELPFDMQVALDRTADRDLEKWSAELAQREERLKLERVAVAAQFASVSGEKATLADRRRVLAEQFAQLAGARAQWQEAESATIAEMEQLARTLRRREAELDARAERLSRADSRRREDAYDLWQLRLRLEAWQSKIVVYELRWHTDRERLDADFCRRETALAHRASLLNRGASAEDDEEIPLALPVSEPDVPAVPAELAALREELDRMAAVLLEAELPDPPDPPDNELPWGTDEVPLATAEPDEADVLLFNTGTRAA